jgi:hypothetical protein
MGLYHGMALGVLRCNSIYNVQQSTAVCRRSAILQNSTIRLSIQDLHNPPQIKAAHPGSCRLNVHRIHAHDLNKKKRVSNQSHLLLASAAVT